MSDNFYAELTAFANFAELTNIENFRHVPSDWVVIITDVRGSTKAIEQGRYRDVNTIGAATIVVLNNVMKDEEYPFVFGGDGATVVIPKSHLSQAQKELTGLSQIALQNFQLTLRIGMVEVKELIQSGTQLQVAKYLLPSGVPLAVFQGGGLALAEEMIKKEEEKYSIILDTQIETDLTPLSCRWKPLSSQKGQVLSLLVVAQNEQDSYDEFFHRLSTIIGSLETANPVSSANINFDSSVRNFKREFLYQNGLWLSCKRIFIALYKFFGMWSKIAHILPKPKNYLHQIPTHCDYHKFDEMLRMVIDVTKEQAIKIQALCEEFHNQKKIYYGIHISNHALMTCVVQSFNDGDHIHFIDGGDGGYAMAAKQLKAQL